MTASLASDLHMIENAARKAGALAMEWFEHPGKVWNKSDNHPVTQADLAVDALLRKTLCAQRPDYGWLSEETEDDRSRFNSKRLFVVDPIDGTRAFINQKPHFVVSIAVVEEGKPIVGAVFNPALDEMYLAAVGQGAKCNSKPVFIRDCTGLDDCLMIASDGLFRQKHWKHLWPDMQTISRNSMAYRMVLVAAGKADATLSLRPKSDWDLAAADLIAREAGAIVRDITGKPFDFNEDRTQKPGVICAGRSVYDLIRTRIQQSKGNASANDQD